MEKLNLIRHQGKEVNQRFYKQLSWHCGLRAEVGVGMHG